MPCNRIIHFRSVPVRWVSSWIMSTILRLIGSIACVVILLAWGLGLTATTNIARADDCLAQPNSSAPEGSHWYFRTDRATQRKCWYSRAPDQQAQQPAADTTSPATSTNPVPSEKPATATSQPIATRPIPVEKTKDRGISGETDHSHPVGNNCERVSWCPDAGNPQQPRAATAAHQNA